MALPVARRVSCDDQITSTAAAAYTPGDIVRLAPGLHGPLVGTINIASGDSMTIALEGIWELPCASGTTASLFNAAYWDSSGLTVVTTMPSSGFYIGRFAKAKTSGQTVANIMLDAAPHTDLGVVHQIRKRCTLAEVNAGVTLLPAQSGVKYRMVDCKIIAIGGNATTGTTVDVLATQSTSSVKLMAGAQASLTQSAVISAGGSGGAVLTDGASYVANDVNTAITVSKTGSAFTVATNFDVLFSYVREAG